MLFKFAAPPGYSPELAIYRADTAVLLDSAAATESAAAGHYSASIDVGAYSGDVLGVLTSPAGSLFGSTTDGVLRSDPSELAAIVSAITEAGISISDADVAAIALAVYRRIVGGSVGVLSGPTVGDPLDVVNSRDFAYSIEVETAADSVLVWSMRRCVSDSDAALEVRSDDGLTVLVGVDSPTAADAEVTRTSATQVDVAVLARALVNLAVGKYVCELREITAAGATLGLHEVAAVVRRSASRVFVE